MDEYVARRRPWRFLEDTEAGLHAACAARIRRRHPLTSPYRPEPPMQSLPPGPRRSRGRSLIIPPEGGSAASLYSAPTPLCDPPIALGPPTGPLAILPSQYPRLYDIDEGELDAAYERRNGRRASGSPGGGDAAGDLGVSRRSSRRGSRALDAGSRGERRPAMEGTWPRHDSSRRRTLVTFQGAPLREDAAGDRTGAERERRRATSGPVPSRLVIEGSGSNVVADSGIVDGAADGGGSIRVRTVRVRVDISRESVAESGGVEDEDEGHTGS